MFIDKKVRVTLENGYGTIMIRFNRDEAELEVVSTQQHASIALDVADISELIRILCDAKATINVEAE